MTVTADYYAGNGILESPCESMDWSISEDWPSWSLLDPWWSRYLQLQWVITDADEGIEMLRSKGDKI